jgi:hypothetical protein
LFIFVCVARAARRRSGRSAMVKKRFNNYSSTGRLLGLIAPLTPAAIDARWRQWYTARGA